MSFISFAAIILSAGRGIRTGYDIPKQYISIKGKTVIQRAIEPFLYHKKIHSIILVVHPDDKILCMQSISDISSKISVILGGKTRQESTFLALQYLENSPPNYVHIHDGVRPFITYDQIEKIQNLLTPNEGVLLGIPVSDTLKKVDNYKKVISTINRKDLFFAQTPQSFPYFLILEAHKKAYYKGMNSFTDDSEIAEWYKIPMKILNGSKNNIKITWNQDFKKINSRSFEDNVFPDIRVGYGYDSHRLVPGNIIILCGIEIPCEYRLYGHSDADVVLHALTDSLLATQSANDIGINFPSSESKWKDAKSKIFLEYARNLISQKKGYINNIDITIITEVPKISFYRIKMIQNLEEILQIHKNRISIKSKTNEKMGFIGRKEGIVATAVATVFYPKNLF